jgi:tetratricopeptide (TPR) repeat protein
MNQEQFHSSRFRPPEAAVADDASGHARSSELYQLLADAGGGDIQALLAEHPELKAHRSLVIDLLYEEYCRRVERGEEVDPDAFCDEFPSFRKSLRHALEVHQFADERLRRFASPRGPHWPEAGAVFLGFCLVRELGRGSFARVFLATEPALGNRPVVLKVSRLGAAEAQTLGRLTHPNIVPIHSAQEHSGSGLGVVCMPYLGSATLCDVLHRAFAGGKPPAGADVIVEAARGAVDPVLPAPDRTAEPGFPLRGTYIDGVVHMAGHLAEALAFIHARGVCHRDLKPSNVLVTPAGRPMLLDFNLSADAEAASASRGGTLPYMAPEQLRAFGAGGTEEIDARADLFAFGVVVYELLTGRHPFGPLPLKLPPPELRALLLERQCRGHRQLREANPRVDGWLAGLLESCMAYRPEDRTQSATELAARLRWGLSWRGRLRRWLAGHTRAAAVVAVAGLVVGGAGAWQFRPLSPEQHLARGVEAYRQQDYHRAVDELSGAIGSDWLSADTLYLRGRAYQRLGQTDAAVQDYEQADAVVQDRRLKGRINACLGYCYSLQKHYRPAVDAGKYALGLGYHEAEVYNNLGFALQQQAELKEAAHYLDEAVRRKPGLQQPHYNRALLALAQWPPESIISIEKSINDIEKAIDNGPVTAQLCLDAARLYAARLPQSKPKVVNYLRRALGKGLDSASLRREPRFEALHADAEFRALSERPNHGPRAHLPTYVLDPVPDTSE